MENVNKEVPPQTIQESLKLLQQRNAEIKEWAEKFVPLNKDEEKTLDAIKHQVKIMEGTLSIQSVISYTQQSQQETLTKIKGVNDIIDSLLNTTEETTLKNSDLEDKVDKKAIYSVNKAFETLNVELKKIQKNREESVIKMEETKTKIENEIAKIRNNLNSVPESSNTLKNK